ncbi:ectoine/hydroxyectoine ABC transporter permease subunit EhuC [Actibacterium pelagium]|uniref:Ectoine/hydroxyectoine ABC transporter permease subunit EhuC n=1 Tax=Actibacterium pelagium TaxID=2029103 RepID=A0A917AM08_9RHOB|nr:ectoine/hydroxyectoine ABC transporter permease subunit EhuC [Actibacterium pelagium]GGE61316.1 ectoine/hydroxyectoine ABC transporter permease subunit EhuC [Actibacterium pelagium]
MSYWGFFVEYAPKMASGAMTTAMVMGCSALLAAVISLIFGLMRLSQNWGVQAAATVYIEFFRGTSLLVQLYWIYYVLPLMGLTLSPFMSGVLALGLNFGAYGAEIVRGGVQSVPRGQWEAALALNMSPAQRMRRIIVPQTFTLILPPMANLTVELLKATALVALITVVDLMFVAKQINATTWLSAQVFGTALIIYYIMARFALIPFLRWLEVLAARKVGKA